MDGEKDSFSEGWSDENMVSDQREAETLPAEAEEGTQESVSAPTCSDTEPPVGLDGQIERFVRAFPDVRGKDIPGEVWERVRGGQDLTEAYLLSERVRLQEENAQLRAASQYRELNHARSAGSQAGMGFGETKMDAFEEGWDVK